jgi:hypothetical protein
MMEIQFAVMYEPKLLVTFMQISCFSGRVMLQAFSRRSVTAETWVRSQISPCEKLGREKWKWEKVSVLVSGFPLSLSGPGLA